MAIQPEDPARFLQKHFASFCITAAIALGATLLYLFGQSIAEHLSAIIPASAQPRSAGTYYPGFAYPDGFGLQLERLGIAAFVSLIGAGIAFFGRRLPRSRGPRLWRDEILLFFLVVAAFFIYLYLATPHNAWPSNARMHWVDIYYRRSTEFQYALLHVLHRVFYDAPPLLAAIYGATNTLLVYLVCRRLEISRGMSLSAAMAFLISANALMFANTAEDLSLNLMVLLFCTYAFLTRNTVLFGLSITICTLGRPNNILLPLALIGVEVVSNWADAGQLRRPWLIFSHFFRNRFLRTSTLIFLASSLPWHAYLAVNDMHFLLTESHNTLQRQQAVESIRVDGYSITHFGGAYLFHLLWIYPVVLTAILLTAPFITKTLDRSQRRFLIAMAVFIGLHILLLEYLKMHYFNVRYITYPLPLFLVCAFLVLAMWRNRLSSPWGTFLVVLAILSTATPYNTAMKIKEKLLAHPLHELAPYTQVLRSAFADCDKIRTTFRSKYEQNYIAYLVRRDYGDILSTRKSAIGNHDCVITEKKLIDVGDRKAILETESMVAVTP